MQTSNETAYISETSDTPLGRLWVAVSGRGLAGVQIQGTLDEFVELLARRGILQVRTDPGRRVPIAKQLSEYLLGERQVFETGIDWTGIGAFQVHALQATLEIPYGETRTYAQIAETISRAGAARAVGRAEATNPMPLVVPCHRVIGSDGKLHGYGAPGGIKTKAWLLDLEKQHR